MDTLDKIIGSGIIAIARGVYGEPLINAARALYDGGVRAFEVTFEQEGSASRTAEAVALIKSELPCDTVIGAGTVLTADQVELAHSAGASFIISPNTDRAVIERTKQLSMVSIPGAMTPTEIRYAHSCGADVVKLFPAGMLGVAYFKAVKAPLAHIPLAAVAGIDTNNIKAFKDAGAVAFGISSSLFLRDAIACGEFGRLTEAAKAFYSALS